MKKTQLYLLAALIATVGLAAIFYKWNELKFPLMPNEEAEVWTVQARIEYQPRRGNNKVVLLLPKNPPGFTVLDERFLGKNYSLLEENVDGVRQAQWTIRRAVGKQVLYYRATVVRGDLSEAERKRNETTPKPARPPELEEPYETAAETLLTQVREGSADIASFAQELVRRFNAGTGQEVELLSENLGDAETRARFMVQLLAIRNIPARIVHGIVLGETRAREDMLPWLQVHNGVQWITIDLRTAAEGWPRNLMLWTEADRPIFSVEDNPNANISYSISRNLADAVAVAEQRLEVQNADLVNYSLLSLPLQAQEVYRILLMVPIGAFIMLLLRNLVGVATYGTFMPVLVALAFRETRLIAGIALFVIVVGLGLLVRFYMERLRLLLVPRLTAVLILVVLLMAGVSVVSNRLGIEVGLSIALFPMVILAMTIERISIAWEERGPSKAMREAFGTLVVASLAYLVMSWDWLEHFVFVFPEVLLVLFALTLVLGRYSGYRLSELFRFRNLAQESEKHVPPDAPPPEAPPASPTATQG